jgi:hypothetical protein
MNTSTVTVAADPFAVYDLPQLDLEIPAEWQYAQVHRREARAVCPLCRQPLRAARIDAFARTRVACSSERQSKRRQGICPECERVLFTELSRLVQNADPFCPAHVAVTT